MPSRRVVMTLALGGALALVPPLGAQPLGDPPARPGARGIPAGDWVEYHYPEADEAARLVDLVPLRLAPSSATREVRMWVTGMSTTDMYRIVRHPDGRVTGAMYLVWPSSPIDTANGERPGESWNDLMRYDNAGRCDGFVHGAEAGVCRALFVREPDWRALLRRLERERLWSLPDPSRLAPGAIVFDGQAVTVELHDGMQYRAYRYDNPEEQPWPQARHAARMMHALLTVDSLVRRADVDRDYRLVATLIQPGRWELRTCGGDGPWGTDADLRAATLRAGLTWPAIGGVDAPRAYLELRGQLSAPWLAQRWGAPYPRLLHVPQVSAVRATPPADCTPGR